MTYNDKVSPPRDAMPSITFNYKDQVPKRWHGHVKLSAVWSDGSKETLFERHNVVTNDASILVAWLMKDKAGPTGSATSLAVGSGDGGWDAQAPPAAADTQRVLENELFRKAFSSTSFIDGVGAVSAVPTNKVDFTTTFAEAEAVGAWLEMGIVGGNAPAGPAAGTSIVAAGGDASAANVDILINYLTFPIINKPNGATFSLTWRISF